MKEGQTLAIAGLLSVTLEGTTNRIPGLGDLPVLGPFFSNTTNKRTEKELIVLVTPCLVEPMKACDVPPTPGDEVNEPTDLEFYLGNRIEGRTGRRYEVTGRPVPGPSASAAPSTIRGGPLSPTPGPSPSRGRPRGTRAPSSRRTKGASR